MRIVFGSKLTVHVPGPVGDPSPGEFFRDLGTVHSGNTHAEDLLYNGSCLRVRDIPFWILGMIPVSVDGDVRGVMSLLPGTGMPGLAFIGALPVHNIVHDVDKGYIVRVDTAAAVRMAVDGNKMDVQFREQDIHVKTRAEIVPSKTGQILHDDAFNLAFFHQIHHFPKGGTVEVGAGPAVIREVAEGIVAVLKGVFLQHRLLMTDTDGLSQSIVILGQTFVQCGDLHRIRRAPKRMRTSPAREAASLAMDTKKTRAPEREMYPVRDQMLRAAPARRNSTGQFMTCSLLLSVDKTLHLYYTTKYFKMQCYTHIEVYPVWLLDMESKGRI